MSREIKIDCTGRYHTIELRDEGPDYWRRATLQVDTAGDNRQPTLEAVAGSKPHGAGTPVYIYVHLTTEQLCALRDWIVAHLPEEGATT